MTSILGGYLLEGVFTRCFERNAHVNSSQATSNYWEDPNNQLALCKL